MKTQKGMYGLPKAAKIANDKLKINLAKFGYKPAPITSGIWRNQTFPLQFSLVVDDFGIKYEHQEENTHLLDALKTICKISEDWYGKLYCGLNLEWDYYKREVLVSMSKYVTKTLHKFQHPNPKRAQYAPHQWTRPNYGATKQLATPLDTSPPIPEGKNAGSKNYWNIPLLCPLYRLHYATIPQHTSRVTIKPIQKYGSCIFLHAILFDEGQGKTKRLFRLLETRKSKHGGLFHETSPTTSP